MITQITSGPAGPGSGKLGSNLRESVNLGQPRGFFCFRKETGANGIGSQLAELVACKSLLGMGEEELVGKIGAEEGGVV